MYIRTEENNVVLSHVINHMINRMDLEDGVEGVSRLWNLFAVYQRIERDSSVGLSRESIAWCYGLYESKYGLELFVGIYW